MKAFPLQKLLQASGWDSRRNIRKMIAEGKFKINGKVVTDPNALVRIPQDAIRYGDKRLNPKMEKKVYFILNKPGGVIATLNDPQNRSTVRDYIRKIKERVYPVGRLDFNSEGLILLTNDGELTNFIISIKNKIPKVYLIKIKGHLNETEIQRILTRGVFIDRAKIRPLEMHFIRKTGQNNSWYTVTIIEGKKHVIRKLFQYSGHPVERLKRIALGSIKLKKLPPGHWRELSGKEIQDFKRKFHYPESNRGISREKQTQTAVDKTKSKNHNIQ